ncbi:MAG TPA: NADH-quinone oxidoreductase subunit C [Nitrososphaerales archaeon]|nr:NADH-quinone oxidoreductase subunit C [Nitrososphaerales archaeon]
MKSPTSQTQPPPQATPAKPPAPPPKPEPVRAKEMAAQITRRFPDVKVDHMRERRLKVTTTPPGVKDLALFVRDELGFDHISAVSGVDWIAVNQLEIVYFVGSVSKPGYEDFVVAIAERVARDDPVVPTLIGVWPGAEYHERETHEMFGINFKGHPSNAHLILPEDWNDMPPLRKDYVSPGR